MQEGWKEQRYECFSCGAEDFMKLPASQSQIPMAVNCWKCKSGRGVNPPEMIQHKLGMRPTAPVTKGGDK